MSLKHQILFILFILISCLSFGQYYAFKSYSLDDGLPQTTVEAIIQDSRGYLWVATHAGASYFDGHKFQDFTTREGLVNNFVFDIKEDHYGNIWFATNGGVTVYTASEITPSVFTFTEKDGLASNRVMTLLEKDGQMILGTNKGLISITLGENNNPFLDTTSTISIEKIHAEFNEYGVRCLFNDSRNQLWVGTTTAGVARITKTVEFFNENNGIPNNSILTIKEDKEGSLWVGTANGLGKVTYVNNEISSVNPIEIIEQRTSKLHIRSIHFDDDGTLYLSYPKFGIFNASKDSEWGYELDKTFTARSEIASGATQVIFKDREGNLWIGSGTVGVSMFMGNKFEAYTDFSGMSGNSIRGIAQNNAGDYWFATNVFPSRMKENVDQSLLGYRERKFIEEIGRDKGVNTNSIWSILQDSKDNIWIGGIKGVYKYDGKEYQLISDHAAFLGEAIMRIYEDRKGIIWFSTFEGVTCYNPENESVYVPFDKENVLYGKRISYFYQDKNDVFWFGLRDGLYRYKDGIYKKYDEKDGLPNNYVALIKPDQHGNLWLGTGKGISMFDGEKFTNYSTQDGLNSDTPYLIIFDDDWNLWVGTNKGLDKLTLDKETAKITAIKFYGKDEGFLGLETNSNAALKDKNGDLWFGTVKGAIRYQKKYDNKNLIEPKTHITRMRVQYKDRPLEKDLVLSFEDNNLAFDYTGISLTNPKKVMYKLRLLGIDKEWSPELSETHIAYSNLPHGNYTFQVMSCNNDGVWNTVPTEYSFRITPPFWQTMWFYGLLVILLFTTIYIYVKIKTKRINDARKVLEKKVKERTTELYKQNIELGEAYAKIEENNKNITDSIHYAKRIQEAILPTDGAVTKLFPKSFIHYQPKDIVSGDFYWVEQIGDLIYFAVVDCTGHGVPGALMSIVGHSGLNQAVYGRQLSKPSDILNFLNKHVNKTLRQKVSEGIIVGDGMDIVLCSLDMKTKELNYSGAFNPLWIMRNDQLIEIKADRMPVGNYYLKERDFTNHKIQLEQDDTIYLFTDGFVDQFGGKKGKKYKVSQLRKFIKSTVHRDMSKQKQLFKDEFDSWKGDLEQVDDMCVIGVKI